MSLFPSFIFFALVILELSHLEILTKIFKESFAFFLIKFRTQIVNTRINKTNRKDELTIFL